MSLSPGRRVKLLKQALRLDLEIRNMREVGRDCRLLAEIIVLRANAIGWFDEPHSESVRDAIAMIAPGVTPWSLEQIERELGKLECIADNQLSRHWNQEMLAAVLSSGLGS